jgi:type IV pilus assembly protein PilC
VAKVKKITAWQWRIFYQHLQQLLIAGLALLDALQLLSEHAVERVLRNLSRHLMSSVLRGFSLTMAARLSHSFGSIDLSLLEAGELSGRLPDILGLLAQHYKRREQLATTLHKALAYPVAVLVLSALLLWLMLLFLVPQFSQLFASFGAPLPVLTRLLLRLSDLAVFATGSSLLFFALVFFGVRWCWFTKPWLIERVLLTVPMLGLLWRLAVWHRFCQSLGLMLSAGVPLLQALPLSGKTTVSVLCQAAVYMVERDVERGIRLSTAFAKQGFFPPAFVLLMVVGENTGRLDEVLWQQAILFAQQLDNYLAQLTRWLEPTIMMAVGVVVGFIVIALYLPIFEMGKIL